MPTTYRFQGKRCSETSYHLLRELDRRLAPHGGFSANSLQRTMAEQQQLVNEKGVWSPSNPTGAAFPEPDAPHISEGHENHAWDIDTVVGVGTDGVQRELDNMGVTFSRTISAEPWHGKEFDEERFIAAGRKFAQPRTIIDRLKENVLRKGSRTPDVIAVQVWMKRAGLYDGPIAREVGTFGPALRSAVIAFQDRVGLKADGIVGPKTAAAMRRRYGWRVWQRVVKRRRARRAAGRVKAHVQIAVRNRRRR